MNKEEYNKKFAELSKQIRELEAMRTDLTSMYIKQNAEFCSGDKVRARSKQTGTEREYKCTKVQVSPAGNFKYFFAEVGYRYNSCLLKDLDILEKL